MRTRLRLGWILLLVGCLAETPAQAAAPTTGSNRTPASSWLVELTGRAVSTRPVASKPIPSPEALAKGLAGLAPHFNPYDPADVLPIRRLAELAGPVDAAQPSMTVILQSDIFGVKTSSKDLPQVRLLDPAGALRAVAAGIGPRPADGQWYLQLKAPDDANAVTVVHPGDRLEVILDGATTTVTAPELHATGDAARDVVSGRVPSGVGVVFVPLFGDAAWLGEPLPPVSFAGVVKPGGAFEVPLRGPGVPTPFDLRPGTWGEVGYQDAGGNVFALPFSPPVVTVIPAAFAALVQADPGVMPELVIHNDQGAELLHTGTALRQGAQLPPRYVVPFFQGGNQDIPFAVEAGHVVELWLDGTPVLADTVPWVLGTIDPDRREVTGLAPAGQRVVAALSVDGTPMGGANPANSIAVTAGDKGTFRAPFPSHVIVRAATATVIAYPSSGSGTAPGEAPVRSDAVAHVGLARVPVQTVWLYGHHVDGVLPGWGNLDVSHLGADGNVLAHLKASTDYTGAFDVDLFTDKSEPATFVAGTRIVIRPELGQVVTLEIPSVQASSDGTTLTGMAPPGAHLSTTAYAEDPVGLYPSPYDADHATIAGEADAGGRFALACPARAAGCGLRFGRLTADVGRAEYLLGWRVDSRVRVIITTLGVQGEATAGLPVTLTRLDAAGRPIGATVVDVVRVPDEMRPPQWEAGLKPLFPEGMHTGDRLRVKVGAELHDVRVLPFTFKTDVARNVGTGTGQPGVPLIGLAVPFGDSGRPDPGIGSTLIGLDGRWTVGFGGLNVKPGDDIYYNLILGNTYLSWLDQSVQGEEPPDPTPTTQPRPTPRATPTGRPAGGKVYVPSLWRSR